MFKRQKRIKRTPIGPTSGLAKIVEYHFLVPWRSASFLCDSAVIVFICELVLIKKKRTAEAVLFKFFNYLSIPASAATEDAFDLSTKPGPEGIFAPGNSPAPLL